MPATGLAGECREIRLDPKQVFNFADFYRSSKQGWGANLNEHIARGTWSLPEGKLHINYFELKAVCLALKEFQDLCLDKIVLLATDNTTVVSYINKEGGMRSGPLCALLWRILTWCTRKQVTLKAQHITDQLNVVADKLSRPGQTIQTEWSLLPEVFQIICSRWHQPQIKLPAQPVDTALHPDPSQKSDKSNPPCMAPRASAIKEHGFSEVVVARIEGPQIGSSRLVYEAKWTIFTKWCLRNPVDRDKPKDRMGIPSWNLS